MADWYCFKCKEQMVEQELTLSYLDIEGTQAGIVCPNCNAKYITEDAIERVIKGEKMIEDK
jgi:DNA-directed RNA polymerase subunit RPC12/RpoP